ncbi:DUF3967 domain-containing protein [Gottfriedia solisilvae]|uniref:DUF3967 domain-containing protein n=1 Tax=Gottfriedia solisilvae TaxID=1516104 RepID=A0A8J3EYU3_9BACI|nr:DUF3967 domain-containing protein [Gottfriedia solisilvae]GGI14602.1 hypothetical protein GCM10007380_23760 [Gottfriedia solisilvae]
MSVILTSKDISKKLKIGKSLVREISKQLEKEAYQFTKNQNTRMYSEQDVKLIQLVLENYSKHQNLPLAVQNGLENHLQNAELMEDEVGPSTQQSIEGVVQIETASNNIDLSGQIDESTYTNEVVSMTEASLNNNESTNSIDHSLHNIKVEADHIGDHLKIVDRNDQLEESSNIHVTAVQNEVHSNHFESTDQFDLSSNHGELVADIEASKTSEEVSQQIVSVSSINKEVVHQMSSNILVEQIELQQEQLQNSIEQLDITSEYDTNHNETVDQSFHTAMNKTELEQIDVHANSHKLVDLHAAPDSNQIMFEEFMSQISNLANQNELILQQNQTLIQQNLLKDQKLEKILHSVEEKSEELQELASVIEEKDEKLEQMFEEIQVREVSRDAQLMRMIREMQETKKMVAASKEKDWKSSLKSFFIKPKAIK